MKKNIKRITNNKFINKNNSNIFHYKKDVETVLKLNFIPYNENELKENKAISPNGYNKIIFNFFDNENSRNTLENQFEKDLNKFTNSLKELKTNFPNNPEIIELEKNSGIKTPAQVEHTKIEKKLKEQISTTSKEENEIKQNKEKLEKELVDIENKIMDLQLNIEVVSGFEKENKNKNIRDKLISKLEKDIEKENNKMKRRQSIKDFQEELNLFIKREEYNTKQKTKNIENDVIKKKNLKKEINEKLISISEKLRVVHRKKNLLINKLYRHYLNLLRDGKDTRNEGLSWIIREIFSLDKKVMLSFMPTFLDKLCIKYLFNVTHLNIEISNVEKEIKNCKNEFKKVEVISDGKDFLIRKNLIENNKTNISNKYLNGKNESMLEHLDKIRQTFCINSNNIKIKNSKSYIKNININKNSLLKRKKTKILLSLPYINGDPNSITNSNKEVSYTNELLKEDLNEKIPTKLRVKDMEKIINKAGYFMNNEEIEKIQNYLSLNKKLNNLRKKKELMKTNEMIRIFKEFQRNDYAQRFNIDKISVISALIGEDNLNSEMVKQSKREKKYIEEIMKGRMHKKMKIAEKSFSVKNFSTFTQFNSFNITNKNSSEFEGNKINEGIERFNSFGNTKI